MNFGELTEALAKLTMLDPQGMYPLKDQTLVFRETRALNNAGQLKPVLKEVKELTTATIVDGNGKKTLVILMG